MKIGIATYQDTGRYLSLVPDEDEMLVKLFQKNGHDVELAIWDNPSINWNKFNVVIIKSTWDYFIDKINLFYNWLDHLKQNNIPCLNHPDLIRWNSDKHYLLDIAWAGLNIVPTYIIEQNESFDLKQLFEKFETNELIIKPCISGGAMNTIRINSENYIEHVDQIKEWTSVEAYLVQPLKKEILTDGEWSFIFFNGKFSHQILKTAKDGEFRIQHFFGGKINTPDNNEALILEAQKYIDRFAKDALYARVDGVWSNNQFELMELELIEPYLFFYTNDLSLDNYYNAFESLTKTI